ncbi:hypothetical protein FRB90_007649 [Tulasnella sp. 427]|nr:hypothetical protein FRB90_007649 [Tulasnella sp. 427]
MLTDGVRLLSDVLGWSYFVLWSISFYPQALLNYRRKRVDGYSIDFATLNAVSFGCYTFYTFNFLFNDRVREEYRERHGGKDNSVAPNDLAFTVHAFILCCITLSQTWVYPRAVGQELSAWHRFVISAFFTVVVVEALSVISDILPTIDFLYHLSYFKLYGSTAKYASQAYLNYTRKSTKGWSIVNVLLDFSGAILSLFQALLIAQLDDNWSSVTGNPAKLGLSILSIAFPLFFMAQHFVLYRDGSAANLESRRQAKSYEDTALLDP